MRVSFPKKQSLTVGLSVFLIALSACRRSTSSVDVNEASTPTVTPTPKDLDQKPTATAAPTVATPVPTVVTPPPTPTPSPRLDCGTTPSQPTETLPADFETKRQRTWLEWCQMEENPSSPLLADERAGVRYVRGALEHRLPDGTAKTCANTDKVLKDSLVSAPITLYLYYSYAGLSNDGDPISLAPLASLVLDADGKPTRARIQELLLEGKGNSFRSIAPLQYLPTLESLSVTGFSLGTSKAQMEPGKECVAPERLADLSPLGKLANLRSLKLSCANTSSVDTINSAQNPVGVTTWSFLDKKNMPVLGLGKTQYEKIRINNCNVKAQDGTELIPLLAKRGNGQDQIRYLELWYGGVSTDDLKAFTEENFPQLTYLDFGGNPLIMTENVSKSFSRFRLDYSALPTHAATRYLSLSENTPTAEDLSKLMKKQRNLVGLELHKFSGSADDLKTLSAANFSTAFPAGQTKPRLYFYNSAKRCNGKDVIPGGVLVSECPVGFECVCDYGPDYAKLLSP